MDLTALDWIIIAAYMLFALGIGLYYSKRASKNSEEYYLAGRSLPQESLPVLPPELVRHRGTGNSSIPGTHSTHARSDQLPTRPHMAKVVAYLSSRSAMAQPRAFPTSM